MEYSFKPHLPLTFNRIYYYPSNNNFSLCLFFINFVLQINIFSKKKK